MKQLTNLKNFWYFLPKVAKTKVVYVAFTGFIVALTDALVLATVYPYMEILLSVNLDKELQDNITTKIIKFIPK